MDDADAPTEHTTVARRDGVTAFIERLLPKNTRAAFRRWYAYLRWVDDAIDEDGKAAADRHSFLDRQKALLDGVTAIDPHPEEEALRALINEVRGGGGQKLALLVAEMIECIRFDADRVGVLTPHADLSRAWSREVRAYIGAVGHFCGMSESAVLGALAAEGGKLAHVVRDFERDHAMGLFNVSQEEAEAFGVDALAMRAGKASDGLVRWRASRARLALTRLKSGLAEVSGCRNIRFQLIMALLVTKYERIALIALGRAREEPFGFARTLGENIALAFGGAAITSAAPRRKARYASIGLKPRAAALAELWALRYTPETRSIDALVSSVGADVFEARKIPRRFSVACLIGRIAFRAVSAPEGRPSGLLAHAGRLYGYWAVSAIELDRLMDDALINGDQARAIADAWLASQQAILSGGAPPAEARDRLANSSRLFASFAEGFIASLMSYASQANALAERSQWLASKAAFQEASTRLMSGQLESANQMYALETRNWSWYVTRILNTKNVEFLLAPFNLWRIRSEDAARFTDVVALFQCLNRAYLHYQLIDDVADLSEDTKQGIVGAPGAILLSQGELARSVLLGAVGPDLSVIVGQSKLLEGDLADACMFDEFRHCFAVCSSARRADTIEMFARCALANTKNEIGEPLLKLAARRAEQARLYLELMSKRAHASARSIVLESGAAHRLLNAVGHDAAVMQLQRQSMGLDEAQSQLAFALEGLMRHTHRAARAVLLERRRHA